MTAPVDFWATQRQYEDHLRPVYEALDPDLRGTWWPPHRVPDPAPLTVVASAGDAIRLGRRAVVLVEHGAGQSYAPYAENPSYSGGPQRDNVVLFLCPNGVSADRNRRCYPDAAVEVVGSPHVDALMNLAASDNWAKSFTPNVTVALTHHWDAHFVPETRWAQPHFIRAYPDLAKRFHLLGHGHPRYRFALGAVWHRLGIEHACRGADSAKTCDALSFTDVVARARVLIADNTSALYEFAALDRPVVVLNAPWYRRDIEAWPRFWACADVGIQVDEPERLADALALAIEDPSEVAQRRREVIDEVFPLRDGLAAQRSAHAIEAAVRRVRSAA